MILKRITNWYRPYYINVNNKDYQLKNIKFYKNNEIIVESNFGWLENKNNIDIKEIILPVDEVKTRRKEKFDGEVFIISQGKELYENELTATIYIPADMLGVHFVKNEIMYNSQVRAVYEGDQDIYITKYIKSIDTHLNVIREEYKEVYNKVSGIYLSFNAQEVINNIDKLKNLALEFEKEKKRIEGLTIDDIEI